jgi:hypothetical protein
MKNSTLKTIIGATILVTLLTSTTKCDIYVKDPESLAQSIQNASGQRGTLDYSISTFGYLDYQAQANYYVKYWPGETGCEKPDNESAEFRDDLYNTDIKNKAFIMKRGECGFYQKAQNAQLAGANLVIVVLNEGEDP